MSILYISNCKNAYKLEQKRIRVDGALVLCIVKKKAEFFFNLRKFYLGYVHSIAASFSWRFEKLTSIV